MMYQKARQLRDHMLRNWAIFLVWGIHFVACLVVMSQPGLGGMGYLSAFAVGLVQLFTAPLMGIIGRPLPSLSGLMKRILFRATALFLAPTVIALWQHRVLPMCTPYQDVGYWLLGPGFGAFMGVMIGASLRGWCSSLRLRWAVLSWFFIAGVNLFWHLWRFYTEPSVFLFHPVAGYLAGPIYDAQGAVPDAYLVHRLWWFLTIPMWVAPWLRRKTTWTATGLLVLGLGFLFRSPLGVDPGRRAVLAKLSHTEVGRYTVLHIDPDAYTKQSVDVLVRVLDHHVWWLQDWMALDEVTEPIHVYIFASANQKQRLIGAGHTEVAKPWLREVYIGGTDPDDSVLRHELAHALAAQWVSGPMAVPTRMGVFPHMVLVEGLATAATWESGVLTPHGWTALMDELGMVPDLRTILGPSGFWQSYGPTVYTISASFIEWYRETYGAQMLRRAYDSGSLTEPVSQSWDKLQHAWREGCLKQSLLGVDSSALDLARERFQRTALFRRPCGLRLPQRVGEIHKAASEGALRESWSMVEALSDITAGDPEIQFVSIQAARLAGDPFKMIEACERLLSREDLRAKPILFAKTVRQLVDALWWIGGADAALEAVQRVEPSRIPRDLVRMFSVYRILLTDVSKLTPADRQSSVSSNLLDYLSARPDAHDSSKVLMYLWRTQTDHSMVQYLSGFFLERRGLWRTAAKEAFCRVHPPEHWPRALRRESRYRCGRLWVYLDELERAEVALDEALHLEPFEGLKAPIRRWLNYIEYQRNQRQK